jgi:hypothetical protein
MPSPSAFDSSAVAAAARGFAEHLAADPRAASVGRIEVTVCGRGPIERLFAVEAALLEAWPAHLLRPPHEVVSSTGELRAAAALTLRALDGDGAEVLRRVYDVELVKPGAAPAAAHG